MVTHNMSEPPCARRANSFLLTENHTMTEAQEVTSALFGPPGENATTESVEEKEEKSTVSQVFVYIDANAGKGDALESKFTITSAYMEHGTPRIIGSETMTANHPGDYQPLILKHLADVTKEHEHAVLIVDVEGRTGLEASHIKRGVMDHYPRAIFIEDFFHYLPKMRNVMAKHLKQEEVEEKKE